MLGGLIGVVLAVVLVANGMGSEYGWNTIRPYLLCSESRLKMFTSKLIADAIFIVAGMIIGVITVILLGVLFTAIRGFSWSLGSGTVEFYRAPAPGFRAGFLRDIALCTTGFSFYGIREVDGGRHRLWHRSVRFGIDHHRIAINRPWLAGKNPGLFAQYQLS